MCKPGNQRMGKRDREAIAGNRPARAKSRHKAKAQSSRARERVQTDVVDRDTLFRQRFSELAASKPDFGPYNIDRAVRICHFLECLRVPSGIGQGSGLVLLPFQYEFVFWVYAPCQPNRPALRRIRRALLSIARKNGKSALLAGLVLVHLIGPEALHNSEVYSAATDRHQAGHIYKMARQMVELDPDLASLIDPIDSKKRLVCTHLGSFYQALSADARRQHGLNPAFVIYDELAQAKDRELYDALSTSFGAQREGLLIVISTQSDDPLSIMSEMCVDADKQAQGMLDDPNFYGIVHQIPKSADVFDEANWRLANPAIDIFRDREDMRSIARVAKRSPSQEGAFRNLYCNQAVSSEGAFVNGEDWAACEGEINLNALKNVPCFGGLDLSSRLDLTAFALCWELPGGKRAVKTWFWLPGDDVKERERRDGARYEQWSSAGFITLLPTKNVDYSVVAQFLSDMCQRFDVQSIAYDRWRIPEMRRELDRLGVTEDTLKLLPFGQGTKDMSPAIDLLEESIVTRLLTHDGNPVLTYCMGNIKAIRNHAGDRVFDKRAANKRIDGAVALSMSLATVARGSKEPAPGPSVYESRGLVVL